MKLLLTFLCLHVIICFLFVILKIVRHIHVSGVTLVIAIMIPLWGPAMLLLQEVSDLRRNRKSRPFELDTLHIEKINHSISLDESEEDIVPISEALILDSANVRRNLIKDVMYSLSASIEADQDDISDKVVPLEEALRLNDSGTRRELIMDVLYSAPGEYISQLSDAKANDDTEVVHYAVTALVEIQKQFDKKFQKLDEYKKEGVADEEIDELKQTLLENYLDSGLLAGDGLMNIRTQYQELLEKKISRNPQAAGWTLLAKKADVDEKLGDIDALNRDLALMQERWADRDEVYVLRIRAAALSRDHGKIQDILREIEEKDSYISPELRELVKFWNKKERDL